MCFWPFPEEKSHTNLSSPWNPDHWLRFFFQNRRVVPTRTRVYYCDRPWAYMTTRSAPVATTTWAKTSLTNLAPARQPCPNWAEATTPPHRGWAALTPASRGPSSPSTATAARRPHSQKRDTLPRCKRRNQTSDHETLYVQCQSAQIQMWSPNPYVETFCESVSTLKISWHSMSKRN